MHTSSLSTSPTPADVVSTPSTRTALVLGGGGSAGNAWLIGVIAGLAEGGLDISSADVIIGTSAGATAAAQITSAPIAELLEATLATPSARPNGPTRSDQRPAASGPTRPPVNHLERTAEIILVSDDPADMRRRMGASALDMDPAWAENGSESWRATVATRLPDLEWPEQRILLTAVDAHTGEPVVFDRAGGVDLVDAVAASTAGGFAYRIGDGWFIDGGYRSNADNADLATGYERVLVLSPFGGRSRFPAEWGMHLSTQVDELRAQGSRVETIFPDADALAAFGDNMMSPWTRPPAARAGHAQGRALSDGLTDFWRE